MGAKNKSRISFFENIIYWLWCYSIRMNAMYPWSFARAIVIFLKFSNIANITLVVLYILDVNSEDIKGGLMLSLFSIILTIDLIVYRSKKYCVFKIKYGRIWDEKYCILKERYDNMSKEQVRKNKRYFFVYLAASLITSIAIPFLWHYL